MMSTQILAEAARQLATVLIDQIQICNVSEPHTEGIHVTRDLVPAGLPVAGLVQSVSLEAIVDGRIAQAYSIKVAQGTHLEVGQAVKVLFCRQEPDLAGKVLLVDTVSLNGAAMLRKATASTFQNVNPQGKVVLDA